MISKKTFRKIFGILIVLLTMTPSLFVQAAAVIVQHTEGGGTGGTINVPITATGAGHLLVALVAMDTSSSCVQVSSVSDGTNNFTRDTAATASSPDSRTEVWYLLSSTAGKTNIQTVPQVASGCSFDTFVYEVSGVSSWAVDTEGHTANNALGSGTAYVGASVTPFAPQIGFGIEGMQNSAMISNPTPGNEFTSGDIGVSSNSGSVSLITTSATAHQPAWTGGGSGNLYAASTIFFKSAIANVPKFVVYNSSNGRKIRLFEGFKIKLQ